MFCGNLGIGTYDFFDVGQGLSVTQTKVGVAEALGAEFVQVVSKFGRQWIGRCSCLSENNEDAEKKEPSENDESRNESVIPKEFSS